MGNKKLRQLILSLTILLSFSVLKGQTSVELFLSVNPYAPCVGNAASFSAVDTSGTVPAWAMSNVWWDFGDGSTASGQNVQHTYTTAGSYTVCAYLWDSLVGADTSCMFVTVEPLCVPADRFEGTVYRDNNGNGTQDAGEPSVPYGIIKVTQTGAYYAANVSGDYSIDLPAGAWNIEGVPLTYYTISQPTGGNYAVTSAGLGTVNTGLDFGNDPVPGQNDLQVTMFHAPPVPGFNRWIYVTARNVGSTTLSGSVDLTPDGDFSYVSISGGGTWSSPTATWNFSNLMPGQMIGESLQVHLDTSATVGDTLCSQVVVNPVTGDVAPADNTFDFCHEIVASYDPNDKQVTPQGNGVAGEVPPGTPFTYRVRFQNTGNFYATNVFIRDTLDSDLDHGSFRVLASSHPMTYTLNNGQVQFNFDNIMLPDSNTNEPASHGFVIYRIQPLSGLAQGTEITNSASIYFDFNPPVLTNTTLNTIWVATSTEGPQVEQNVVLFPNPVTDRATVRFDAAGETWSLQVIDITGRTLYQRDGVRDGEVSFNRGDLPEGTYLYRLSSDSGSTATGKFIVQ